MPTDCPQRDERMGWLGDRATGCIGESFVFGNTLLYEKWLRDIEAMLLSSQRNVTGTVELILRPRNYTLVGVDSTFDLMKTDFGEYGEVNKAWTADDVKGFTKILGNQMKIYYNVQARNGKAKK